LISSLRSQLTALSEQSHQLNTKLVASISRHADLEDQHFNLQHERDELKGKNAELTKTKESWENKMNTGLYVEQSQIRDEMQRLAAGLVEEERKRGSAEQRRQDVENEVDELATSLFEQASSSWLVLARRLTRRQMEWWPTRGWVDWKQRKGSRAQKRTWQLPNRL
jgi:chromosome segregation ATPase